MFFKYFSHNVQNVVPKKQVKKIVSAKRTLVIGRDILKLTLQMIFFCYCFVIWEMLKDFQLSID